MDYGNNTKETLRGLEGGYRENNFTILRIIATAFVFAGHMGLIRNGQSLRFGGLSLEELGVSILFLLSGYLITMSWLADPDPIRYAVRRFFRLWPPFAVMVLLMVFVAGPLLSDLGREGYFSSWYTVYLQNLRFFVVYAQPGVFTDLPIAYATNGSLWTMPVEAAFYVLTPFIATFLRVRGKKSAGRSFFPAAVFTAGICVLDLYLRTFCQGVRVVFYGTDMISACHMAALYSIGMLFTWDAVRKHLNVQAGCAAMCLLFIFQYSEGPFQYFLMYLVLPYFVFSIALAPKPLFRNYGKKIEISYGIYLYGFFFQQLIVFLQQRSGIGLSYTASLVLSALPTIAAALLSCFLVERPVQRFGRFLLCRLRKRG